jgi:hypothetical protein
MSENVAFEEVSFAGKINPGVPQRTRHAKYIAIDPVSKGKLTPISRRYDDLGELSFRKDECSALL